MGNRKKGDEIVCEHHKWGNEAENDSSARINPSNHFIVDSLVHNYLYKFWCDGRSHENVPYGANQWNIGHTCHLTHHSIALAFLSVATLWASVCWSCVMCWSWSLFFLFSTMCERKLIMSNRVQSFRIIYSFTIGKYVRTWKNSLYCENWEDS